MLGIGDFNLLLSVPDRSIEHLDEFAYHEVDINPNTQVHICSQTHPKHLSCSLSKDTFIYCAFSCSDRHVQMYTELNTLKEKSLEIFTPNLNGCSLDNDLKSDLTFLFLFLHIF